MPVERLVGVANPNVALEYLVERPIGIPFQIVTDILSLMN